MSFDLSLSSWCTSNSSLTHKHQGISSKQVTSSLVFISIQSPLPLKRNQSALSLHFWICFNSTFDIELLNLYWFCNISPHNFLSSLNSKVLISRGRGATLNTFFYPEFFKLSFNWVSFLKRIFRNETLIFLENTYRCCRLLQPSEILSTLISQYPLPMSNILTHLRVRQKNWPEIGLELKLVKHSHEGACWKAMTEQINMT